MPDRVRPHVPRLRQLVVPSRRQFLLGAAASALLVACGDDDTATGTDGGTTTAGGAAGSGDGAPELSVVRFYGPYFVAGVANRVPFGLADADGILPTDAAPDELTVSVEAPDGTTVAEGIGAPVRAADLPRPYYAFEFTPPEPGFYGFTVRDDGVETMSQLQVVAAGDEHIEGLVGPGDAMPPLLTPTVSDPRGVDPICTREPMCDLHDVTVADVVGTGPLVLLVATPAFCQTVICGPVLDILLERAGDFPDVTFVHAEVFREPENNAQPPAPEDYAPVIGELGLPFEPVLYTVGADGVVRERLDYIFGGAEISEAIGRLLS